MNSWSLQGNWVDLLIIVVIAVNLYQVKNRPAWLLLAEFLSFVGSLLLSLRFYKFAAEIFKQNFTLPQSVANAFGFLATAIILEMLLGYIFLRALYMLPKTIRGKWNKYLGYIPALGESLVFIAFVLTLVMGLPVQPAIKVAIADSKIGGPILQRTTGVEHALKDVFGGVIEESLTYITIRPESTGSTPLTVDRLSLSIDEISEQQLFKLVNEERTEKGLEALVWAPNLVPVARSHAKDMWERKYFGHESPEGEDVGDRLEKGGVTYFFAGENLALAPTVQTAHTGLMNSEGHRKNILESQFKKIGIGVVDNAYYGKLFVQVFTD